MLYYARYLSQKQVYVSSDKFRGIIDYPIPFNQLIEQHNSPHAVPIMGDPQNNNAILNEVETLRPNKQNKVVKFWNINDQIAYFFGKDNYLEYFGGLPTTVKVLSFDIEIATIKGQAPNHNKQPILSIGISIPGETFKDYTVEIIDEGDERKTILKFFERIRDIDPDITTGYYSEKFDIPFIFGRMEILGIRFPKYLHRYDPKLTYFNKRETQAPMAERPLYKTLGLGRIHYDLFSSVRMDTSIKTKNIRLKTVAEFFKSETIFNIEDDEKSDMLELYNNDRERYNLYLISDIHQTMVVFNTYFLHNANMAMMVDTSLDSLINGVGRAPFARIFMSRAFISEGIYPATKNIDRNQELYSITDDGSYRGAYTGIRKTGIYRDVCKVDFKSMYPSLIVTFNISPDTVKFVGYRDLERPPPGTKAKFELSQLAMDDGYYPILTNVEKYTEDGKVATLRVGIPDELLGKYIYIDIDQTKKGIIPINVDKLFELRDDIKGDMANHKKGSNEFIQLNSQQMGVKIANNSNYGIFGNQHLDVGDLACAMLVTGFGREITHACISMIGEDVIEIDSVVGDTIVYVKHKITNIIELVPIESLHADNNIKRIAYQGQYQIWSRNGWVDIRYTKAHSVNKDIHRIKISDGYVDVTADHSLFRKTQEEVSPKDLLIGDEIELTTTPNVIQYNQSWETIYGTIPLNVDTAWVLGLFAAEGSITQGRYGKHNNLKSNLSISMKQRNVLEHAMWIFNTYFIPVLGPNSKTVKPPHASQMKIYDTLESSATYRLEGFYNNHAYQFFKTLCYSFKDNKQVPIDILNNSNMEIIKSFITGYEIGDGHVAIHDNRLTHSYTSIDTSLVAGVQFLLHRLNYLTTITKRKDKLNITDVKVRQPVGVNRYKVLNSNQIGFNDIIIPNKEETLVYDISTDDGTFVAAIGNIVLHNTDGYYASKYIDSEDLNEELVRIIDEKYPNMPFPSRMILETEKEGMSALFLAMKNYIVENPKDKSLEATGSSLKGSSKSLFVERIVLDAARQLMDGINPVDVRQYINDIMEQHIPNEEFKMSMRITKDINDFDTDGGLLEYKRRILAQPHLSIDDIKLMLFHYIGRKLGNKEWIPDWEYLVEQELARSNIKEHTNYNRISIMLNISELVLASKDIHTTRVSPSIYFKILANAHEQGIQVMAGESIEYYMSANHFTLYNQDNIRNIPINFMWYKRITNNVVDKMLTAVHNQILSNTDDDMF